VVSGAFFSENNEFNSKEKPSGYLILKLSVVISGISTPQDRVKMHSWG